jgi:hypothetical protein
MRGVAMSRHRGVRQNNTLQQGIILISHKHQPQPQQQSNMYQRQLDLHQQQPNMLQQQRHLHWRINSEH